MEGTMTDEEELAAALDKAIALCAKVEKLAAKLPPKKRGSLMGLRHAGHSVVGNLGEALRIKRG
jgi:hypothetical protein